MKRIITNISIWYINRKNGVKILSDNEYERLMKKYSNTTVIYI